VFGPRSVSLCPRQRQRRSRRVREALDSSRSALLLPAWRASLQPTRLLTKGMPPRAGATEPVCRCMQPTSQMRSWPPPELAFRFMVPLMIVADCKHLESGAEGTPLPGDARRPMRCRRTWIGWRYVAAPRRGRRRTGGHVGRLRFWLLQCDGLHATCRAGERSRLAGASATPCWQTPSRRRERVATRRWARPVARGRSPRRATCRTAPARSASSAGR
jgi:hypothetical protein